MKRFLSLLLAALMLVSLPALAEVTRYDAQGFAIDFDAVVACSANSPVLVDYGMLGHYPFMSAMIVGYYAIPKEAVEDIQSRIESAGDGEESDGLRDTLSDFSGIIASILVTDAKTPAEAGIDPLPEGYTVTEFGTMGDYHYYYLTEPMDALLAAFDTDADLSAYGGTAQELKQKASEDIEAVHSEILKQLRAAELYEPTDPDAGFIGKTMDFESTDLDGNPVSSADLFKDNKITMVNVWGTWCINCMNEMGELAELHKRLQQKGCGIVGVEWEQLPLDEVADLARQTFADYGVTYPNALMPDDDPIFNEVTGFPTTFFVDSEGKILTYPIVGANVDAYEPTVDKLLAGESADAAPANDAVANDVGAYRAIVCDADGNPVKGVVIQLCDDTTCTLQKTDADGVATFQVETPKVYEIHVAKAPEGYAISDEVYMTLDTFSDVNITIGKAE